MNYIFYIFIGIAGRLFIHIPDVTPLTPLCLLAPSFFSKRISFLLMFIILFLSDLGLHFLFYYSIFGSWTFFTYSGWLGIIFLGFLLAKNLNFFRSLLFTFYASIIFWIWTNFGTWIATSLYSHNIQGLLSCYVAALPFLRNSILGSLVWMIILICLRRTAYVDITLQTCTKKTIEI